VKIAVLDDYQNVALKLADWSALADRAEITVFDDHVAGPEAFIERLLLCDAGATGAILTTRLIHSMRRDGLTRGMVTLCIGGPRDRSCPRGDAVSNAKGNFAGSFVYTW
jgi:hypothetical protein